MSLQPPIASPEPPFSAPPTSAASSTLAEEPLAPWAPRLGRHIYFSMFFRLLFFLLLLPLFFAVAVWMRLWVVVTVVVVGLIVANLFNHVTRLVDRFPKIKSLGPLGHALEVVVHLRDFYREHQPAWFVYYTFFPIAAPIACLFSRVKRSELKIWGKTFIVLITGDVVTGAATYSATYPPYLTVKDALKFVFVHIALSLFLSTIVLMPLMTTALTLSLSGRRKSLFVMSVLSLVMMGVSAVGMIQLGKNRISFNSDFLLHERMRKPDFRREIRDASEILVTFLAVHSKREAWAQAPEDLVFDDVWGRKFRSMVSYAAINDEPKAFRVFHLRTAPNGPLVFGTLYVHDREATVLYVEDLDTHEIARWGDLNTRLRDRLLVVFKTSPLVRGLTLKHEMVGDDPG
jgi:hypothetical protein